MARKIFGLSYEKLIDEDAWKTGVRVFDPKAVRSWVKQGLPITHVAAVAHFFGLIGRHLEDSSISDATVKNWLYQIKAHRSNPQQFTLPDFSESGQQSRFNWQWLATEMRALVRQPVYGDKNCFLERIFIFPNGRIKTAGGDKHQDIGPLKDYILNFDFWTCESESRPLFLFGDFGIGKSSFLKILTSHMHTVGHRYFPIYIPLRELPVYDANDLVKAIKRYLDRFGQFTLNRLDRDVLLLLDGFDELNFYDKEEKWIRRHIKRLVSLAQYRHIQVIITSRPLLFLKEADNIPANATVLEIKEFEDHQVQQWIDKWKVLPGMDKSTISYARIKERLLLQIVRNPLLLYMTAKIYDTELKDNIAYSKGVIYQRFYDWTIKGKFKDEGENTPYQLPTNYRQILQNIAMTMRAIGESGAFIEFESLKRYIFEFQRELPEEDIFELNELILTGHFFKLEHRRELKYVEFGHQSFKEYLVAEKICDYLTESFRKDRFDDPKWLTLGRHLPSVEEFEFLKDLLYELPKAQLVWFYSKLRHNTSQMLIGSGGFKKVLGKINFSNDIEINTIYFRSINLLAMAYLLCHMIRIRLLEINAASLKKLDEGNINLGGQIGYIYHVCHTASGGKQYNKAWDTVKRFLEGSNFNELHLDGIDFHYADLKCTDFIKASIARCCFDTAELHAADFSHAQIQFSDFSDAACDHTVFEKARLSHVRLHNTYMVNCAFNQTEFDHVDFSGAYMKDIHFENCTFNRVLLDNIKTENCTGLPFSND